MWPRAAALVLGGLLAAVGPATADTAPRDVLIGVVESVPRRALQLAAAAAAGSETAAGEKDGEGARGGDAVYVAPVEPDEPLSLANHICAVSGMGAWAALSGGGVGSGAAAAAARAGVPLILPGAGAAPDDSSTVLAMHPTDDQLAEVGVELALSKGWSEAVVLHARSPRPLLARAPPALRLVPRALPAANARTPQHVLLRNLLLVLKKSGARNFIVWSDAGAARGVLAGAARVGLLDARRAFLLLTLDLHTRPLAPLSHGGANITALRLRDPHTPRARAARDSYWGHLAARLALPETPAAPYDDLELPAALTLAHDAARRVTEALAVLRLPPAPPRADPCATGEAPLHADTLLNYLRSEGGGGGGGGTLQVTELARGGQLQAVARWAGGELAWARKPEPPRPRAPDEMAGRTFTVLVAVNDPYVMRREAEDRLAGNERFEGFCVELVARLAELLHFNYTLVEQADGVYGSLDNRTGEWTGMMHRLLTDDEVDFAITDLTMTAERVQAADFTTSFMNLGLAILYRKPRPPEPETFAFLLPFSRGVWLLLVLAVFGSSLCLLVCGRLSPGEWQAPFPCEEEPARLHNQLTPDNALWFTLGAVLLQGSEVAPVGLGTRACASAWWVFALVVTSSYTANLATLLAEKRSEPDFHGLAELADSPLNIAIGAKAGGSTYTLFEQSQNELYQKVFDKMKKQPNPASNAEGIRRVMKGEYAFIAESTTIEYVTQRNCEVVQVGEPFESKDYGLAMKKSSPYRQALNLALLNLQESGTLREMKLAWWNERHGGGACKNTDEHESEKLDIMSFIGLFAVLGAGCGLGALCGLAELMLRARRTPGGGGYWRRVRRELRFVLRLQSDERPVDGAAASPAPSSSPAPASTDSAPSSSPPPHDASPPPPADTPQSPGTARGSRRRSSAHARASLRLARAAAAARRDAIAAAATSPG